MIATIPVRDTPSGATIPIRVQPGAKKTAITGIYSEGETAAIKLSMAAPPIEGRANEAVIEFFAELFGVPKRQVIILFGETSRSKVIQVTGRTSPEIMKSLQPFPVSKVASSG